MKVILVNPTVLHEVDNDFISDLLCRILLRWSTATRKRIQRRERFQQLEQENALVLTTNAWARWRDAFRERQLAGLVGPNFAFNWIL